jgi:hypothetical protein
VSPQHDAMSIDRAASPEDLITDGWYFHQHFDRRLNENAYIVGVTWFTISNSPAPGMGQQVMATEVLQVGDLAIPRLMRLYQHLVSVHNKLLPTGPLRHKNPNQPRNASGKFTRKTETQPGNPE